MIAFLLIVSTIGNVCSMSSNPKWATQLRNTFFNPPSPPTPPTPPTTSLSSVTESAINIEAPADLKPSGPILSRGLIDYIGNSTSFGADRWSKDDSIPFVPMTSRELFNTRFNLWRQLPWKKIKGKFVLKAKVSGEISLESASRGFSFGGSVDVEEIDSVTAITTMLFYGAQDPRVQALFVEFDRVGCGYAKLTELRRAMKYFRDSGKKIIGYCAGGAEKEFFLSLGCDEFFIPPDGGLDLRGFSGSATFVRGVFEKIGLEPQVQRIGKYKSFGDTFNRTSLSDAQREVISSLLVEASDFWADQVATRLDKPVDDVKDIWSQAGIKTPYQWADLGFVTGVSYLDQVEERVRLMYRREITSNPLQRALVSIFSKNATSVNVTAMLIKEQEESLTPFDLKTDFALHSRRSFSEVEPLNPYLNNTSDVVEEVDANDRMASAIRSKKESVKARFFPAGLYLRKMRKGFKIFPRLPYKESMGGPRIAVINAVGGISSGKSGSGAMGATLGSDTLISLVRSARYNPSIRAVVIRVDSPGGSALASDLMWREIRLLSREKPVIASMVDVAASGGYYIGMACDQIVAEDLTVTGSIGVVTAKFNAQELNRKIGYVVETVSRGRYAEILSTSRGFTEEEDSYFADGARQAYLSFITKAAASRNMTVEGMNEVAQGRVWTGAQAKRRGLVDHSGGLWRSLQIAASMAKLEINGTSPSTLRIQTLREPRSGFMLPFASLLGMSFDSGSTTGSRLSADMSGPLVICDDAVAGTGLVSDSSLGISPLLRSLGCGPLVAYLASRSTVGREVLGKLPTDATAITSIMSNLLK